MWNLLSWQVTDSAWVLFGKSVLLWGLLSLALLVLGALLISWMEAKAYLKK